MDQGLHPNLVGLNATPRNDGKSEGGIAIWRHAGDAWRRNSDAGRAFAMPPSRGPHIRVLGLDLRHLWRGIAHNCAGRQFRSRSFGAGRMDMAKMGCRVDPAYILAAAFDRGVSRHLGACESPVFLGKDTAPPK